MATHLNTVSIGEGYGIVVGLGVAFIIVMVGLTYVQNKFTTLSSFKSEEFNTASRSVKPGLIASGIVSAWTHGGTFLTACTQAYKYGVAGPMWIAGNGCFQILFFAMASIKVKRAANGAHTFPEIVYQRHGKVAHVVFTCYALACNLILGTTLMAGSSAVFTALTGVNIYAMYFIFPAVCTSYIIAGGLRSTFINDYIHTVILFVLILVFCFEIYVGFPGLGSIDEMYARLTHAQTAMPATSNYKGSYLTVNSRAGLIANINIFISSFTSVWVDQAFWQRIIASNPHTAVKAYILGGIAWYGVPISFATAIGLACVAIEASGSPLWPFGAHLSAAQVNAGLAAPAVITAIMGKTGALTLLVLLFMATTSSTSAEIIAASSIWTFDVHKSYIKKDATGKQLLHVSMYALVGYSLVLASFSCLMHGVGVSLNWLASLSGALIGSGAIPIILILLWDRTSQAAAVFGPLCGLVGGLLTWLITTYKLSGIVTVTTTMEPYNALAGDCGAVFLGGLATIMLTLAFPAKAEQHLGVLKSLPVEAGVDQPGETTPTTSSNNGLAEERGEKVVDVAAADAQEQTEKVHMQQLADDEVAVPNEAVSAAEMKRGTLQAWVALTVFSSIFLLIWPFTLYGTKAIWPKSLYSFWVVLGMIWVFVSSLICIFLPLWESRFEMRAIVKAIFGARKSR